ncbi:MAG: dihydroxyacetone kinase subunit DhaL [Bacilli bacterium]
MLTAEGFGRLMENYAARLQDFKDTLNDLDNRIGDGDHGTNMTRGFTAVADKWRQGRPAELSAMCQDAGMTLLGAVGGASGPLYGTVFLKLSGAWRDALEIDLVALAGGLEAAYEGLVARGKAAPGDKTMLDVWRPALDRLQGLVVASESTSSSPGFAPALEQVSVAAQSAALATKEQVARKGRASYLGERSRGTCDPGGVSSALFFEEIVAAITGRRDRLTWNRSAL